MNDKTRKSLWHAAMLASALGLFAWAGAAKGADTVTTYSTADDAAVAGLNLAEAMSDRFEVGSGIYQCGTRFAFMPLATSNKKDAVAITIYASAECRLAAVFHTHPKGDSRYSVADIKSACSLHTVSYIKPRNGNVRAFDCTHLSDAAIRIATTGERPITGDAI